MKTFFASCSAGNTKENENYSFILHAKTESSAKKQVKKEAVEQFNNNYEEPATSVVIDELYETSEDARL